MANIWEHGAVVRPLPANAPRGGTDKSDFSGLHRPDSAEPAACLIFTGEEAEQRIQEARQLEDTVRRLRTNGPGEVRP